MKSMTVMPHWAIVAKEISTSSNPRVEVFIYTIIIWSILKKFEIWFEKMIEG